MILDTNDWVDVYVEESIEEGRKLKVFNHSNVIVVLKSSATQPVNLEDTITLLPNSGVVYHAGQTKLWISKSSPSDAKVTVTDGELPFSYSDNGLDPRAYTGYQGVTTQPFVEANVKNGTQFEAASFVPVLASGATIDTVFTTGSHSVLIKGFDILADGAGVQVTLYESPTFTGGTPISGYNLSAASNATPESTILAGVTTSATGTQKSSTLTLLGATTPGTSKSSPSGGLPGLDRVLKPNTTYLRRIVSIDGAGDQRLALYTTWYEGPLSTELF